MGPYPLRRCGSHPVPSQCPLLGGGGAVHIPLPPPDCCRNLFSPRCAPHPRPHAPPAPQLSTLCCLAGAFCFWGASSALLPYPVGNPLGNGDPHTFPPPPPSTGLGLCYALRENPSASVFASRIPIPCKHQFCSLSCGLSSVEGWPCCCLHTGGLAGCIVTGVTLGRAVASISLPNGLWQTVLIPTTKSITPVLRQ